MTRRRPPLGSARGRQVGVGRWVQRGGRGRGDEGEKGVYWAFPWTFKGVPCNEINDRTMITTRVDYLPCFAFAMPCHYDCFPHACGETSPAKCHYPHPATTASPEQTHPILAASVPVPLLEKMPMMPAQAISTRAHATDTHISTTHQSPHRTAPTDTQPDPSYHSSYRRRKTYPSY